MRQQNQILQESAAGWSQDDSAATRSEIVGSEDIHVRNYDHQWGYDLSIKVTDAESDVVFVKRYYLPPGRVESELDALPSGEYEIEATLDNLKQATLTCRIDDDPEHSLVIEIGNGALSLTEGLFA